MEITEFRENLKNELLENLDLTISIENSNYGCYTSEKAYNIKIDILYDNEVVASQSEYLPID